MGFIYALKDPRNNEIRYVGITKKTVEERIKDHLKMAKTKPNRWVYNWINEVLNSGMSLIVDVLEEVNDSIVCERERYWILYGKENGWRLTNATEGGEGVAGYRFTENAREKISKSSREKWSDPSFREKVLSARKGYHHTEETKRKISVSMSGLKRSEEGCKNIGLSKMGVHPSEETRQKLSVARKGVKKSEEARRNMSAAQMGNKKGLGKHPSPETREKLKAAWVLRRSVRDWT
jgi:hypothetical protein